MDPKTYKFDTLSLHGGHQPDKNFGSRAVPIYQTTSYVFQDTDHAAAFSFYANKNITTGGEGGALATNNTNLAEKVKKLSLHGITKDGWNRFKTNGSWEYDITELGYKYNLTDSAASVGIWQMDFIKQWQGRRKELV